METINIIDNKIKITLYLNHNKIYFVNYSDDKIDIKKYINMLCMPNYTSFFNDDNCYNVLYRDYGENIITKNKLIKMRNIIFVTSLSALLLLNVYIGLKSEIIDVTNYVAYSLYEYDVEFFKNKIFASHYLSMEEKKYIYNEDFLSDIITLVNSNNHLKMQFEKRFTDIRILSFGKSSEHYEDRLGYYTTDFPSTLFVRDYNSLENNNKDTVAHEFIHMCQETYGYNFITEACAEIISNEYFDNTYISSYHFQIKLLKILMEIIGPYPIWYYNFTGDFSLIEEKVKPNLTYAEYDTFIDCLSFNYSDYIDTIKKEDNLKEILFTLYTNMYGGDILDNDVIYHLLIGDSTLVRNYFNKRFNESYYLDYANAEYATVDMETAMSNNMVFISCLKKTLTDYESAMINVHLNNSVSREIDFKSNEINISRSCYSGNKLTITGYIDGVQYEDADVDELYAKDIINVTYYLVDYKLLSAEEYINHEYDDDYELFVTKLKDVTINDDFTVYGKVPKKVLIPSVFDNNVESVKTFVNKKLN